MISLFQYIFDANKVYCKAFSQSLLRDIPMPGMKPDACIYTHCPIISGQAQTYSNQLFMSRIIPSAPYTVKMWLWDANYNGRNIGCCFTINIRLRG
ncbi:hypothetical protein WA026_013910 [Henosepilachna vigintioctopunctata]|uniref:MD-2-related lipid-recognition domain-containing protein n=1 Tax=Henosepilachna vigintioctopunctata TaxID=420089 RepID=A0AAW1TY66_9CUCU